ncbi:HIT family protein [Candidatus Hepatoplasma crinochetorum]|uniref:HIT family protein n=1 Tax=Candidatus Hepatoplasma crinochetorum Av TaxID=1427984 RepID=W8GK48_9MOLU|nr:HIT family protein [Candidatus Hepatoplasma crinochetorum]AHK22622.1 HIT family protein [Candidatus Hepatoplasma crinochetorum Av]BDV03204.1 MAG: histidine triad protein [Candidatus Hepatoplasma crinochetorum]
MEKEIFLKIIEGKTEALKLYEDNLLIVIMDIYPFNPGHILIIPKIWKENIYQEDDKTILALFKTAKKISDLQEKKLKAKGTKILFNNGAFAGQKVFHTHMHIIPFFDGQTSQRLNNLSIEEIYQMLKK